MFWQVNNDVTLFLNPSRLVCVTGRSAHDRTDIVQVDVDQSGTGTSKESFSYLVSIYRHLPTRWSLPILLLLLLLLCSLVPRSPLGKPSQACQLSVNRCVLWFWGMRVCGNLQTFIWAAAKHQCHSAPAASKNKYGDCWNVPSLWIHLWSAPDSQHCVNGPRPTQSPFGFWSIHPVEIPM